MPGIKDLRARMGEDNFKLYLELLSRGESNGALVTLLPPGCFRTRNQSIGMWHRHRYEIAKIAAEYGIQIDPERRGNASRVRSKINGPRSVKRLPSNEPSPEELQLQLKQMHEYEEIRRMEEEGIGGVPFLEIIKGQCRFPVRGEGVDLIFCGFGTEEVYCRAHRLRCSEPAKAKRNRRLESRGAVVA